MQKSKTHFEQVPVAVVKKLLEEGIAEKTETEHDTVAVGTPSGKTETRIGREKMASAVELGDQDDLEYPDWQRPVQAALVELDKDKLKEWVAEAEAAIFERQQAISQSCDHHAERVAIEYAAASLRVVKREILEFPDWEEEVESRRG
jgi:hypothetical protein